MKLKTFQKQDLSRAGLHNGLILSWDTGLWKTGASYLWPLLKCGHEKTDTPSPAPPVVKSPHSWRLAPKAPVLQIVPGDLHHQSALEGVEKFNIETVPLDSQETFTRLCKRANSAQTSVTDTGKPILPPGFYITSYSQLTTNGVQKLPDAADWDDVPGLLEWLSLTVGEHQPDVDLEAERSKRREQKRNGESVTRDYKDVCHFFAHRGLIWEDEYQLLGMAPADAASDLERHYSDKVSALDNWPDQKAAGKEREKLQAAHEILQQLVTSKRNPKLDQMATLQRHFIIRMFCAEKIRGYEKNIGEIMDYPIGPLPEGYCVDKPETDTRIKRRIKCVYSPSLADLCYNAFDCVVIDEGVKMKGKDTLVGRGVRSMEAPYRLVLTATPVKNRLTEIFWLAWWAAGGKPEAHARFPYRSDDSEQSKFAETFMVSERNLTAEAKAREKNATGALNHKQIMKMLKSDLNKREDKTGGRYKKLTAEVCNVHRLWKLLAPIVLRRRKQDCGEDIVPKIRRVVRCEMGTLQQRVYQYHLQATYLDKYGEDAIGAKLQALRMAAADPSSADHLKRQPGEVSARCECTYGPEKPALPIEREDGREGEELEFVELRVGKNRFIAQKTPDNWSVFTGQTRKDSSLLTDGAFASREAAVERVEELANKAAHPEPDYVKPKPSCKACNGKGAVPLPHVSGNPYIPKVATTLTLVEEVLARGEQVVVFSAFNDPLDNISRHLREAGVRHCLLDGRTSQKKRGGLAAVFKKGRFTDTREPGAIDPKGLAGGSNASCPVMLAGVECMAEGHSFHLANNVILIAYSWAYDKFIQAINRVHRMNSAKPVNVYVVLCQGTIDARLESLIQDKGDAAELVLDGRLIGERTEEVNLAELLNVAHKEFDTRHKTLDEALIQKQWPALRDKLQTAMWNWDGVAPTVQTSAVQSNVQCATSKIKLPIAYTEPKPVTLIIKNMNIPKPEVPTHTIPTTPLPTSRRLAGAAKSPVHSPKPKANGDWRAQMAAKVARLEARSKGDIWSQL